jgi:hypothetical protein
MTQPVCLDPERDTPLTVEVAEGCVAEGCVAGMVRMMYRIVPIQKQSNYRRPRWRGLLIRLPSIMAAEGEAVVVQVVARMVEAEEHRGEQPYKED